MRRVVRLMEGRSRDAADPPRRRVCVSPRRLPRLPGVRRLAGVAALLFAVSACGGAGHALGRPAPETLPAYSPLRVASLGDADAWLRHYLVIDDPASAVDLLGEQPVIGDPLLRSLQTAIVLRRAGDFAASNALLEQAEAEADRRRVRSVSETAGSLIVNDRVIGYTPRSGEATMIPYYRMTNYLHLNDFEAAAVEARRVSALLVEEERDPAFCASDGMLRYIAGMVFEAAGEHNDALVALRQAAAGLEGCGVGAASSDLAYDLERLSARLGLAEASGPAAAEDASNFRSEGEIIPSRLVASEVAPVSTPDAGEVMLVLERGFVAHRVEAALHVPIFAEEIELLEDGEGEDVALAAAGIVARLAENYLERDYWGRAWDDDPGVQFAQSLAGAHILRLAWAGLEEDRQPRGALRLVAANAAAPVAPFANLSLVAARELEAERIGAFARLVTRGVAKYLVSRELEKKAESEGGELLGFVTGRLANFAANESERADTRSWTLLPDEIAVARLTLPPGCHRLTLELTEGDDGSGTTTVDLGMVEVVSGEVTILNHRIWLEPGSAH